MTVKKLMGIMALYDFVAIAVALITYTFILYLCSVVGEIRIWLFVHTVILAFIYIIIGTYFGIYRDRWQFRVGDDIGRVFNTLILGTMVLFAYVYIIGFIVPPFYIVVLFFVLFGAYIAGRGLFGVIVRSLGRRGYGARRLIILGTGFPARTFADKVRRDSHIGYKLIGFIQPPGQRDIAVKPDLILGELDDLRGVVVDNVIDEIVIAQAQNPTLCITQVIETCVGLDISIRAIPDMYNIVNPRVSMNRIEGAPLVQIIGQPLYGWYHFVKRVGDIVFASGVLAILWPIWPILWFIVRHQSGGSLIYFQERTGFDGKAFKMFKFRSMIVDAEKYSGPTWATDNDPRIIPIGRFLRKYRIDEIPQMVNVLRNEMSVIGPRPERPSFVEELAGLIPFYRRRLLVKPGITGLAQVKHKYDESLDDVKEKVKLDLSYIDNLSLTLDIRILFWTVGVLLTGKGAK